MKDKQSDKTTIVCPRCGRTMYNTYNRRFICESCGTVEDWNNYDTLADSGSFLDFTPLPDKERKEAKK